MTLHYVPVIVLLLAYFALAEVLQKPLQKLHTMPNLSRWQILGPFPAGMREQDFGADPLEAYGKISDTCQIMPRYRFSQ